MTAAAAIASFLDTFPALPPEAAPVYFLLCGESALTVPGIARRLDLAQSSAARLLALLSEAGVVMQTAHDSRAARWELTAAGRALMEKLGEV